MSRSSAAVVLVVAVQLACREPERPGPAPTPSVRPAPAATARPPDPFEAWLEAEFPVADGFDPSLGGTEALAVAHGRVAFAGDVGPSLGHVVMVDHVFYENHERREIRSVYKHLAVARVRAGDGVKRGAQIGSAPRGALRLELRWDKSLPPTFALPASPAPDPAWVRQRLADPVAFVRSRRRLAVPQDEPALLLVSTKERRLRVRLQAERVGDFEVGFGQGKGRKRLQHDLKTPLGMYFVIGKSRGPFTGPYGAYYGGLWIKVNYPNAFDADWGREQGLLAEDVARSIGDAWRERKPTFEGSPLGGGIGFHGWADDWDLNGPRGLSWGCVVMRNDDIRRLFDRIPLGAMVVIF